MGLSLGFGKTESEQSSGFNQDVWGGQANALENMYGMAGGLFQGGNQQGGLNDPRNQPIYNGIQNQMGGGAYRDLGVGNQLMQSINQSMNSPSASQGIYGDIMTGGGNTSLGSFKNSIMDDAANLKGQNMALLDSRANAAGMSGGARQGVAQANMMNNIDRGTQSTLGNLGYNAFDTDLNRKLGIAAQADSNNLGRQQLMGSMLNNQQQTQNLGINSGMQYMNQGAMMPWQQANSLAQIMGNPTVLSSGNSSGSSSGLAMNGSFSGFGGPGGGGGM